MTKSWFKRLLGIFGQQRYSCITFYPRPHPLYLYEALKPLCRLEAEAEGGQGGADVGAAVPAAHHHGGAQVEATEEVGNSSNDFMATAAKVIFSIFTRPFGNGEARE